MRPQGFTESASSSKDTVEILFAMNTDPALISTPFARIGDASYFGEEAEELFSMQTVFCIDDVKRFDNQGELFAMELTLTANDDHHFSRSVEPH